MGATALTQDEALEQLQEKVDDHDANLADAMSRIFVLPGASGSRKPTLFGRVNLDWWTFPGTGPGLNFIETGDPTDSPQDRVRFRRLRFGVQGKVNDLMEYKIAMEFAGGTVTTFKDAYLGFNDLSFLQTVLIGNQKRPYGLDQINSARYNVFMERPLIVDATIEGDTRRFGIASYGVSDDEAWNWRFGLWNMQNISATGRYVSDHYQLETAGRLANTFWWDECSDGRGYGHWAISASFADPDGRGAGAAPNHGRFRTRPEAQSTRRWIDTGAIAGADFYELLALEGVLNVGPVQFVSGFEHVWLQRQGGSDLSFHGAYAYVSYFLTGEHMPWNRRTGALGRIKPFENFFLVERCCGGSGGGWGAWQIAARLLVRRLYRRERLRRCRRGSDTGPELVLEPAGADAGQLHPRPPW